MNKKLAIISTHPIQYYAPVFEMMAKQTNLKVFYTWGEQSIEKFDKGFNKDIKWDLPLLEGYKYLFLENRASDPGTHHFNGIINPHLIREISAYKPDAILIYGWAWQAHLKAIVFFKGKIPIYFRGDSTLLNKSVGLLNLLKTFFLRWIYRHIDIAFYVGKENKSYYEKYGLKQHQLRFAPHAIDNNRFSVDKISEATSIRERLGIGKHEILILFAGKFDLVKNPTLLLEVFIELNAKDVHLLFVGNGILEKTLKIKNKKKEADPKKIHFMDFQNQSQMPAIYQACDLFCLPSSSETWGLSVNEAMASGKAILVSDQVACAKELIEPGINGDIFKSGDSEDLKDKLRNLTSNKNTLKVYGKASEKIIKTWTFERQAESIIKTLNF